jgi:hypothetical protein
MQHCAGYSRTIDILDNPWQSGVNRKFENRTSHNEILKTRNRIFQIVNKLKSTWDEEQRVAIR